MKVCFISRDQFVSDHFSISSFLQLNWIDFYFFFFFPMELSVLTILGSLCISLLFSYVNGRNRRHESNKNILTSGCISVCKFKWGLDSFGKGIYLLLVKLYIGRSTKVIIIVAPKNYIRLEIILIRCLWLIWEKNPQCFTDILKEIWMNKHLWYSQTERWTISERSSFSQVNNINASISKSCWKL